LYAGVFDMAIAQAYLGSSWRLAAIAAIGSIGKHAIAIHRSNAAGD
jgi:hypothetical protein